MSEFPIPFILRPRGEGKRHFVAGDIYTILADSTETNGAYALVHARVLPGGGPPPHVHSREAEAFYVLEGEIEFLIEGQWKVVGAGGHVMAQPGTPHAFRNATSQTAQMIFWVMPGGFEHYFEQIGRPVQDASLPQPPPTESEITKMIELAPDYGIKFL